MINYRGGDHPHSPSHNEEVGIAGRPERERERMERGAEEILDGGSLGFW